MAYTSLGSFPIGSTPTLRFSCLNKGDLKTPAQFTLKLTSPVSATMTNLTWPAAAQITNPSLGVMTYIASLNEAGTWTGVASTPLSTSTIPFNFTITVTL